MEISIQTTDNPRVIKFVVNRVLLEGSLELDRNSDISNIPLARELFNFPFITRLFITANFIAVAKEDTVEWDLIATNLQNIITESLDDFPEIILPKEEKKSIFYIESTPNPEVMKFITDENLINGTLEVKSREEAENIPLAKTLFDGFSSIKEIFINDNYIAITKAPNYQWDTISKNIQKALEDFLQSGQKISNTDVSKHLSNKAFTETEEKINTIIMEYVTPAVENDGGKISLIEFDEDTKTAKMLLQGACSGCPSSTITLKNGIENLLKSFLPDIVENVEAVNG